MNTFNKSGFEDYPEIPESTIMVHPSCVGDTLEACPSPNMTAVPTSSSDLTKQAENYDYIP